MSERSTVEATVTPITRTSLGGDLKALGLDHGDLVIVHASMKSLGWVCGGAQAVIEALLDVLGCCDGTLVMPTHTNGLTDPAAWQNPAVPEAWWDAIRAGMPGYDPHRSPTRDMGAIPELFRSWPGVRRSAHPHLSLAALGLLAGQIVEPHGLDDPLGPDSPYARLYEFDAKILMIGTGYDTCTMLHVAERQVTSALFTERAPVLSNGQRQWVEYRVHKLDSDWFPQLAPALDASGICAHGKVGLADTRLLGSAAAVDQAVSGLRKRV